MLTKRSFTFIPGIGYFFNHWNFMTKSHRMVIFGNLITKEEVEKYKTGASAQDSFPALNRAEREFVLSGMNQAEQDRFFDADFGDDVQTMRQQVRVMDWEHNSFEWAF